MGQVRSSAWGCSGRLLVPFSARGVLRKKQSTQKAAETGGVCRQLNVNRGRSGRCHPSASHLQAVGVTFQGDTKGSCLVFHFCCMVVCHSGNGTEFPA